MRAQSLTALLFAFVFSCGSDGGGQGLDAGSTDAGSTGPTVLLPKTGLVPAEIGVLVNANDPQSVAVGDYYQRMRGIPIENVITLNFATTSSISAADFAPVYAEVVAVAGPAIQGFAVTWTMPYRVGCMSMTSALALGFDTIYCNTSGMVCAPTGAVQYYDSDSVAPYSDFQIRPAMMLAAQSEQDAFSLIDRGIAADNTFPTGDGYFVRTTDGARSVRWGAFLQTIDEMNQASGLALTYVDNFDGSGANFIQDTTNVLLYFTGLANVPAVATNTYVPGAVADHLTSSGGRIPSGGQMSVVEWLEAGVTASYGTVIEPCNYTSKFPNTNVVVPNYFRGATILEAYWKSVRWPGEGLFVGEPLARPWGASFVEYDAGTLTIRTTGLIPNRPYQLLAANAQDGPYTVVLADILVAHNTMSTITLTDANAAFYKLSRAP